MAGNRLGAAARRSGGQRWRTSPTAGRAMPTCCQAPKPSAGSTVGEKCPRRQRNELCQAVRATSSTPPPDELLPSAGGSPVPGVVQGVPAEQELSTTPSTTPTTTPTESAEPSCTVREVDIFSLLERRRSPEDVSAFAKVNVQHAIFDPETGLPSSTDHPGWLTHSSGLQRLHPLRARGSTGAGGGPRPCWQSAERQCSLEQDGGLDVHDALPLYQSRRLQRSRTACPWWPSGLDVASTSARCSADPAPTTTMTMFTTTTTTTTTA